MKFPLIIILNIILLAYNVIGNNENLVPNPEMKSKNGKWPNGWRYNRAFKLFSTQNGVVSISENSPHYTNYVAFYANVDGYKSYKFSVEVKIENIENCVAIFYNWLDAKSVKVSRRASFIFKGKGNSDWQTVETILSADNSVITKKISVCLNVYKKSGSSGKALFRNPQLYEVSPEEAKSFKQKTQAKTKKRQASKRLLNNKSFCYNFTMKPAGVPYCIEKGTPGCFPMITNHPVRQSLILKAAAPQGSVFELYLYNKKKLKCQYIKPHSVKNENSRDIFTFQITKDFSWQIFGNSIFFAVGKKCPATFEIQLDFLSTSGKKLATFSLPAKVIPAAKNITLPKSFRSYSWYSYPLGRIDLISTPGKLPQKMLQNWQASGFSGGNIKIKGAKNWTGFKDFTHTMPFWSKDYPTMPRGITVGGAQTDLICPSALIKAGATFFEKCIKEKNREQFVKKDSARIVTDYEPYAGRNGWVTKSCFCKECTNNFAKYIDISPAKLTPQIILSQYKKQWVKFRCTQRSRIIRAMADAVHSINPKAEFVLCSMPMPAPAEKERYFNQYGINLELYDSFTDVHMPMNYSQEVICYQRLEQNARVLKKPLYPVLDNGWGKNYNYHPERIQQRILTVALLGGAGHYAGAGLLRMDGEWLKMFKQTHSLISKIEPFIKHSRLLQDDIKVTPGLYADKNLYYVYRKNKAGKILFLAVNNSKNQTIFFKISNHKLKAKYYSIKNFVNSNLFSPDNKKTYFTDTELENGFKLKLKPLSFLLLEFSPGQNTSSQKFSKVQDAKQEEKALILKLKSLYNKQSKYGMSAQMTLDGYLLNTPSQNLLVNLNDSATGLWKHKKNLLAKTIARDWFVFPELCKLKDLNAKLLNCRISPENITAVFVYKIPQYTYKGLVLQKTYILDKKQVSIKVKIKIIPEEGYRPFRYRVSNILGIGVTNPSSIKYRIPKDNKIITDNNADVAIYISNNAKFPDSKPFFSRYSSSNEKTFAGSWIEAIHNQTGQQIKAVFNNADQLFLWRKGNSATLEWIYPNAYPDNDPHKVKTWETEFTLKYTYKTK